MAVNVVPVAAARTIAKQQSFLSVATATLQTDLVVRLVVRDRTSEAVPKGGLKNE
jgi:hypothetical protein